MRRVQLYLYTPVQPETAPRSSVPIAAHQSVRLAPLMKYGICACHSSDPIRSRRGLGRMTACESESESTALDLIHRRLLSSPEAPALLYDANCTISATYSYVQLLEEAAKAAAGLRAHGTCGGTRVALLCDEAPSLVVAFVAIVVADAVVVPIDPAAPQARLSSLLLDCGASLVLCDDAWMPAIVSKLCESPAAVRALRVLSIESALTHAPAVGAAAWQPPTGACECHLIYTSGSTGRPKGVLVDHRALRAYCEAKARAHRIGPGARVLLASAHTWDPCIGDVFSTLSAGALLVTAPRGECRRPLGPLGQG